ncbi:SMI1/KNR4 family protein [Sphingobacterium sp. LRF_L2]|uniref:SMI1/KNR4 family protein n=1 Tax=Sphingobacterium sp. LRF_L2 TaxID=3369421 RepID=UPI003F63864F
MEDLTQIGIATEFGDLNTLENFRFPNGLGFPTSYKNFVLKYGYGVALGEFHIYLPMGSYGDSLFVRSSEIQNTYINDVNENDIWFDLDPDGSPDLLKRLFPFASSDNGLYLFWDPSSDGDQEFDIYITDFRGIGFRKVGQSLNELFDNLTESNFRNFLPFSSQPLPKTFRCLSKKY